MTKDEFDTIWIMSKFGQEYLFIMKMYQVADADSQTQYYVMQLLNGEVNARHCDKNGNPKGEFWGTAMGYDFVLNLLSSGTFGGDVWKYEVVT